MTFKRLHRTLLLLFITLFTAATAFADETREEKKISIDFRANRWEIDSTLNDNALRLRELYQLLEEVLTNPRMSVDSLSVSGYASPDGPLDKNKELSLRRAISLRDYLVNRCGVADSLMRLGENRVPWDMFREKISASSYPWADEAMLIMAIGDDDNIVDNTRRMNSLKSLAGGEAWRVLCRDILPKLRSAFVITTVVTVLPEPKPEPEIEIIPTESTDTIQVAEEEIIIPEPIVEPERKPFYMALYSNMLFDVAGVPNLGVEFYLGKNWSMAANYMHAWWSRDSKHRFWRIYGGDVNVRWWFGKQAHQKPLTGHHIGAYVQAMTYDFEWGGKAYMAGEPGGTILDRAHIGGGIEYGYSLPIAKRLNIDFSLGVGYIGGRVYEFEPDGDRYIWTATKNKHWFGPTKLEISLVWLLGRGNKNVKALKTEEEEGGEP